MKMIQIIVPIIFEDLYYLSSQAKKELCSYTNNSVRLVSSFMRLILSEVDVYSSPIITIDNSSQHTRNPLFHLNSNNNNLSNNNTININSGGCNIGYSNDVRGVNLRQYVTDWVLYTVMPILQLHIDTIDEMLVVVHDLLCIVQNKIIDSGCRYQVSLISY